MAYIPNQTIQTIKTNFRFNPAFNNAGPLLFNMFKIPAANNGKIKIYSINLYNKSIASLPDNTAGHGNITMGAVAYDGINISLFSEPSPPSNIGFGLGSTISNLGPGVGHVLQASLSPFTINGSGVLPDATPNNNKWDVSASGSVDNAVSALSSNQLSTGIIIKPKPAVDNFISILVTAAPSGGNVGTVGLDAIYDAYIYWSQIDTNANLIAA